MGGQPFLALNLAALPPDLPEEISSEIIRGGAEKAREAGVVIAGGHTVQDKEPKYGLVVVGFVHPERMLSKAGAAPGDRLVLTKPLGFGVTTTALKRQTASAEDIAEAVRWMKQLNAGAARLALTFGLKGGTDITGYGLLGHAAEMAESSGVGLRISMAAVPLLSCARKYANLGTFPGGAFDNKAYFGRLVQAGAAISESEEMLLFDPQTSGGLLLAVPEDKTAMFLRSAEEMGQPAWVIGEAVPGSGILVEA
jgi:selenide,water dikinase